MYVALYFTDHPLNEQRVPGGVLRRYYHWIPKGDCEAVSNVYPLQLNRRYPLKTESTQKH